MNHLKIINYVLDHPELVTQIKAAPKYTYSSHKNRPMNKPSTAFNNYPGLDNDQRLIIKTDFNKRLQQYAEEHPT